MADTDADGLLDGEEVCHIDATGAFTGGWAVSQFGDYWTCSNPLKADNDGDGLLDSAEKLGGFSPESPNTAPSLRVVPSPYVRLNGSAVSVLRAGDSFSVTTLLNNSTADAIDQPVTLDFATDVLEPMTVVTQTGSLGYVPPTPTTTGTGVSWDMADNPLLSVERMTSTLSTSVNPALTESQITTMEATVVYTDVVANTQASLTQTVQVIVDMDDPSSTVAAPAIGQAIKGTAYVHGRRGHRSHLLAHVHRRPCHRR